MILEVLADVEARVQLAVAAAGEPTLTFAFGEHETSGGSTPRIVWVPKGGTVTPAKASGGDGIDNPGGLWSRAVAINAHVWCDDVTAVERLMNHLVAALYDACSRKSHAILGETWDTKSATAEGVLCLLSFELRLPFTREPLTTVLVESTPFTTHLEHPNG
jgi:hypothetical protein